MITEDYVSFETAKLLKEKGFDELTYACFSNDGKETYYGYRTVGDDINRPTLQMAMKWLREVHNIHFFPDPFFTKEGRVAYGIYILDTDLVSFLYENLEENTYEQACEAAIKYCLEKLI